jgi:lysozyme
MSTATDLVTPLVKHFEGLYLTTYTCPAGRLTIGYGHTGRDAIPGITISEARADNLLADDLDNAEYYVTQLVKETISAAEQAALISFVFNLGCSALAGSTLLRVLNAGDHTAAAGEFLRWDKAHVDGELIALKGLTRRRQAESTLFLTGKLTFNSD